MIVQLILFPTVRRLLARCNPQAFVEEHPFEELLLFLLFQCKTHLPSRLLDDQLLLDIFLECEYGELLS